MKINGGKGIAVTLNGKTIKTDKALVQRAIPTNIGANTISLKNNANNLVYVNLVQKGKLPLGKELSEARNLKLNVKYYDGNGNTLDVSELRQGTEITTKITVSNSTAEAISNIALSQLFPSGWEIVNTSFKN